MFDHISFDKNSFDKPEMAPSSDFIISSYGNVTVDFEITYDLEIVIADNFGGIAGIDSEEDLNFELITPLLISIIAASKLEVSRFGNTDVSYIYLEDITLAPGEEIIIDTDLLTVFLNGVYDVSAITPESTFFELGPGSNDLLFYPEYNNYPNPSVDPSGNELDINLIWQNRWL